jgi:DNA polymerase III subunit delta'
MAEEERSASVSVPLDWLPWHQGARTRIETALTGGRLPHGLLLHGPDGVGKEHFATVLGAGLLCKGRGEGITPCGQCPECALVRAGSHPDLHWLRRPEDRKSIGVDAVREACDQLGMTSMRGGYRVAIVTPAHLMTHSAMNALLKTLEEPAPRTLLVLVTSRPSGLLATLRSRCQRVEIPRPPADQSSRWLADRLGEVVAPRLLELAGGAPLKALELAPYFAGLEAQMTDTLDALLAGRAEVTRLASGMLGEGLQTRLDWLEAWLGQAVRAQALPDATGLTVPGGPLLQRAAVAVNITAAFRMLDRVRESRRLLEGSAAAQLVVEALLVELKAAIQRRGVA